MSNPISDAIPAAPVPTHPPAATPTPPSARWTPPFISLPIYKKMRHQFDLALNNVESTVIVGPKGIGKTETMLRVIRELQAEQMRQQLATGATPRDILWYATADATGRKTVLTDIYTLLVGRPLGRRSKQDWTATEYIRQIMGRLRDDRYVVICIDEAQHLDASNIELLRQLMDAAPQAGHTLRLILIGDESLPAKVAETGQLGERFTGFIEFPRFAADSVAPHLTAFHPGLAALQASMPAKAWKALERALFTTAGGSFRRLSAIIANAHELALLCGRPMTEQELQLAMQKLPPEII